MTEASPATSSTSPAAGFQGKRLLFTGPTSQVGEPIAKALAAGNEVFGVARFSNPKARARLEEAGVTCITCDLTSDDFTDLPDDIDYVVNFAVTHGTDWDADIEANCVSPGRLMYRYESALAFLHCSSTAVYEHAGPAPRKETDPLGDNHRGFMETYSIVKIAAEVVARTMARTLGLPTTIARLNVPYGNSGGWPLIHLDMMRGGMRIDLHPERPNVFTLLHEDDMVRMLPGLLAAASVPATVVNWGGEDVVSIEEWCGFLTELTGIEAEFGENPAMIGSVVPDLTKMRELVGPATIAWRDGVRRMVQARRPDLLRA
ncbi:MAG TPA: NAD(P)-dependent oxidoreductase [Acidimicrobiales bacterium]|jgi:nucleoside-diphosphate-sugar epimerase|nr:NAD(P)-dependent oxidoreductase [Acidimicrobiales bacterium]